MFGKHASLLYLIQAYFSTPSLFLFELLATAIVVCNCLKFMKEDMSIQLKKAKKKFSNTHIQRWRQLKVCNFGLGKESMIALNIHCKIYFIWQESIN